MDQPTEGYDGEPVGSEAERLMLLAAVEHLQTRIQELTSELSQAHGRLTIQVGQIEELGRIVDEAHGD